MIITSNKHFKKRLFQIIFVITFLFVYSIPLKAQLTDTIKSTAKSNPSVPEKKHSPRKATIMSAACPGLGQIYNKKYWKLPIIYVGFGAIAYSINYNQTKYVGYRNDYLASLDSTYPGPYRADQLLSLQHYYHRYRDLSVIGAIALYLLNIVDASVDAHLFSFDVSENLSWNVHPTLMNTAYSSQYYSGIELKIRF